MSLFPLNGSQARERLVAAGALFLAGAFVAGCGNGYRPVITPISPSGPAAQPSGYAVTLSSPGPNSPGVASIIDYSGDTIMAQANVGANPVAFSVDGTGGNAYTLNGDGTLTYFPVSRTLQQLNVQYTTLPAAASVVNLFTPSAGLWATDLNGNVADVFSGYPATFKLAIPVGTTPVALVGSGSLGQRDYAITQNFADSTGVACNVSPRTATANGEADAIETSSYTVSARLPVGKCPVFAVMSPDQRRLFVLNRGDDTITVINSQNNAIDACTPFLNQNGQLVTCHPSLPLSTSAGLTGTNVPVIAGPVYAEYNGATNQLVVSDYDGNAVSVIDVSLDVYGNDSATFGTTFTIPVGTNPASVTALYDGSRAYTANQGDGTVSVVNLSSHTVEKTLPVNGHPRTVVSTKNSIYGKVYVSSPDSPYLSIIRTDQDIIDTNVLVQGNIVDVRVSTENGGQGNSNVMSRRPGFGQPCYLPPALLSAAQISADPKLCSTMP
ncbi:MAG: YncE family protein [Acidobacteriota bacterium]